MDIERAESDRSIVREASISNSIEKKQEPIPITLDYSMERSDEYDIV